MTQSPVNILTLSTNQQALTPVSSEAETITVDELISSLPVISNPPSPIYGGLSIPDLQMTTINTPTEIKKHQVELHPPIELSLPRQSSPIPMSRTPKVTAQIKPLATLSDPAPSSQLNSYRRKATVPKQIPNSQAPMDVLNSLLTAPVSKYGSSDRKDWSVNSQEKRNMTLFGRFSRAVTVFIRQNYYWIRIGVFLLALLGICGITALFLPLIFI